MLLLGWARVYASNTDGSPIRATAGIVFWGAMFYFCFRLFETMGHGGRFPYALSLSICCYFQRSLFQKKKQQYNPSLNVFKCTKEKYNRVCMSLICVLLLLHLITSLNSDKLARLSAAAVTVPFGRCCCFSLRRRAPVSLQPLRCLCSSLPHSAAPDYPKMVWAGCTRFSSSASTRVVAHTS